MRAPAELAETGPERSGAETERGRSGDGAGARAVPKRRSERSIPKSREAATAFSPLPLCGSRRIVRAYAVPPILRPLQKLRARFICRRQRRPAIPGRRHARDRAGQAATSVRLRAEKAPRSEGSAQRGLRRSLRRRGLNEAGPKRSGAGTERGRERGSRTDAKADGPPGRLPSPLPSVWAGGRGRFHPSYSAS